jgi:ATP/maltotriose-dependent transcriptional regulator MalT
MAVLLASRGEVAEARRLGQQVAATAEGRAVNPEFLGFYTYLETELLLVSREFDRALELVTNRLEQLERYSARFFLPLLILNRARALRGLGRRQEARDLLDQARGMAEEIGLRLILLSILLEIVELATELGEHPKAESSRQAARATIQFISQHVEDPALLQSFHNLPRIQSILPA